MMKKMKFLKRLIPAFILLAAMTSMTSCNRGVGCPNNFTLDQTVETVIGVAIEVLPALIAE